MTKSSIAIATDSTAYIPPDLVEKHNLHIIPLWVNWEGDSLRDDVDIKPVEFYRRLQSANELPTTSQPSVGDFHDFFKRISETSESIVGIFISDKLSGTLASARTAKEMLSSTPIELVDSQSASMGLGFMVLAAARAREQGLSHIEVARIAREMVPKVRTLFVVDTLEYLHKGGRIGGAKRLIGSVLSIKPLLPLEDGKIEPLESIRTKRKALNRLLEIAHEEVSGKGPVHTSVIHAAAHEEAEKFADQVREALNPVEVLVSELSPVVGTHTGPGLVGLGYYSEESLQLLDRATPGNNQNIWIQTSPIPTDPTVIIHSKKIDCCHGVVQTRSVRVIHSRSYPVYIPYFGLLCFDYFEHYLLKPCAPQLIRPDNC